MIDEHRCVSDDHSEWILKIMGNCLCKRIQLIIAQLQLNVACLQAVVGCLKLATQFLYLQMGFYPGPDLFWVKRLGDVIYAANLEGVQDIIGVVEGAQENDRHMLGTAQLP